MRLALALLFGAFATVGCSDAPGPRTAEASDKPPALRLMLAPASVKQACQRVRRPSAQQSNWRVVCPPLVPRSKRLEVTYAGGVLSTTDFGPGYLIDGRDAAGESVYAGHWTFASGRPDAVRTPVTSGPGHVIKLTRTRANIGGQRVLVLRVKPGMTLLSGHVVVEWVWHGQAYQVSVHRWRSDRQGLEQAITMATAIIRQLRGD
jgi:hypothetical protein